MKTFFIKQHSTLPDIKFELTQRLREKYDITKDMLDNVAVTFSMIDAETGNYRIANEEASFVVLYDQYERLDDSVYTLVYRLKRKETRKAGKYYGEFKLTFLDEYNNCERIITLPTDDNIIINIEESITKVDLNFTPTTNENPYYYGTYSSSNALIGDNRPVATESLVLSGIAVNQSSNDTITITFNSLDDDYIWFAIPESSTSKTTWYVSAINTGAIGGIVSPGGNLFPNYEIITVGSLQYKVYISNYQVEATSPIELRN